MTTAAARPAGQDAHPHNRIRIGYARVSTRSQDHQAQLDALTVAHCREVVVETASTRSDQPKLRATLGRLQPGDTLVIYKPDRVARSMKELLVFLEDEMRARPGWSSPENGIEEFPLLRDTSRFSRATFC